MPPTEGAVAKNTTRGRGNAIPRAKKAEVAMALGTGMTIAQAAEHCGVSRNTITGMSRDPEFLELVQECEDAAIQAILEEVTTGTRHRIKLLQDKAGDVIEAALNSEDQRVALQAATTILRGGGALTQSEVNVRVGLESAIGNVSPAAGD